MTHLPRRVNSGRLSQEQTRLGVVGVKADDQGRDSEGANTAGLSVLLLHAGDVLSDVLDSRRVLDGEAVRLALDARLVDEDTAVSSEAWGQLRFPQPTKLAIVIE